jgi:hypothetical protein
MNLAMKKMPYENETKYAVIGAVHTFYFPDPLALEIFIARTGIPDYPVFLDGVFEWTIPLFEYQKEQIAWVYKKHTGEYPKQKWLDQPAFKGKVE